MPDRQSDAPRDWVAVMVPRKYFAPVALAQPLDAASARSSRGTAVHRSRLQLEVLPALSFARAEKQYVRPGEPANQLDVEAVDESHLPKGLNPPFQRASRSLTSKDATLDPEVSVEAQETLKPVCLWNAKVGEPSLGTVGGVVSNSKLALME